MSSYVKTGRFSGKIRIRKYSASQLCLLAIFSVLIATTILGFITIDTKGVNLAEASVQTLRYFGTMFFSPRGIASHFQAAGDNPLAIVLAGIKVMLITLALSFLTTVIGAIIALFLGLLAARNLTNQHVSNLLKGFISVIRAVPTVLWVLIFAIGAGLGAVAAVIGMSFHTVGYLLKAYSESFEEIDDGVIEALRASGANWFQIVFQAVLPSSVTALLSWTFLRFEINFAVAVAMGAAAGAGGIGYQLWMAAGYFFDIKEIGFITYLIVAVALVMELLATKLKEKYHIHE
ncbi:MAG: ABC transporter permease subunit [Spirochaetales bacterium]|nr:ABC transporter permease subunit [Spirochaetales bacterium]